MREDSNPAGAPGASLADHTPNKIGDNVIAFPNDDPIIEHTQPLLPEGEYRLRYLDYYTLRQFRGAAKLALNFSVIDFGEYFETRVSAYYNVLAFIGRPGRNGRFKVGAGSNLAQDLCRLFPGGTRRMDRLPIRSLGQHIVIGRIGTVTTRHNQVEYPDGLRYSVVRELIRIDQ